MRGTPFIKASGALILSSLLHSAALAGDPLAVREALARIQPSWPAAQLSVDVQGLADTEATVDQSIAVRYEAAQPGYMTYLRVSGHGDISVVRPAPGAPQAAGSGTFNVKPPLGGELVLALFSNQSLDSLLGGSGDAASLGSDGARASQFVDGLRRLQQQGLQLAVRRYEYMVVAPPGGTEYTTRGIIRQVAQARRAASASARDARMPGRIGFEFGSDRLTTQGKYDLDVFGAALVGDLRGTSVTLVGYTDDVGTADYNQALSERRAAAARSYLIDSFGLPPTAIKAVGKGMADPVASNASESERSRNRRVEFIFASQDSR